MHGERLKFIGFKGVCLKTGEFGLGVRGGGGGIFRSLKIKLHELLFMWQLLKPPFAHTYF